MNSGAILLGILPLIFFVIVDSFSGMKAALISAVILCLIEAIMSYYFFHELDLVTLFSFFLVLVLAGTSYYCKTSIFFKFQPVILSVTLGIWFIISYWMDNPLLLTMMIKYKNQMPAQLQENLQNPLYMKLLKIATHYCGFAFIAHGGVTAFAALKLSNWWWIAIRGIGFYVLFSLAFFLAIFTVKMQTVA